MPPDHSGRPLLQVSSLLHRRSELVAQYLSHALGLLPAALSRLLESLEALGLSLEAIRLLLEVLCLLSIGTRLCRRALPALRSHAKMEGQLAKVLHSGLEGSRS